MANDFFLGIGAPRPIIDAHFTEFGGGKRPIYPPASHADGRQMLVSVVGSVVHFVERKALRGKAQHLMDVLRDVGVERSYDKPVLKSVFKQQSHRFIGALESIILKLYVKRNARRRDKLKKFLERRYFFAFKLLSNFAPASKDFIWSKV